MLPGTFSSREIDILRLMEKGFTNQEVARTLFLALDTIKWYNQRIFDKLGVSNRRQAVQKALELGLVKDQAASLANEIPSPRHNLPTALDSFIGRQDEITAVMNLLSKQRLVTLTGAGGVGKTRLAICVAESLLAQAGRPDSASHTVDLPDEVWFQDLAPLADPDQVPLSIFSTIGAPDQSGRPILDIIVSILKNRKVLLLLDNCEHLLEACAQLADDLLHRCPHLKLLATSREALRVPGETVYVVPSLKIPEDIQPRSLEEFQEIESVRIFTERTHLVIPTFQVTEQNTPALARVCQRLDGIPLALELSAARMNMLTVEELAARLDDAFQLLADGSRAGLPRHRTLRATMDWSYNMLSEAERILLRRLSVFVGSWTLAAAEEVCKDGTVNANVFTGLSSLVDKSMVVTRRRQGSETRYRFLETVRQYARVKLREAGEEERFLTRHCEYFLGWAEEAVPRLKSAERLTWTQKIDHDWDNLRAAVERSFVEPAGFDAGSRLFRIFEVFRDWQFFLRQYELAQKGGKFNQAREGIPDSLHVFLLVWLGWVSDDQKTRVVIEQGLSYCQSNPGVSKFISAFLLGVAAICLHNSKSSRYLEQWSEFYHTVSPGDRRQLLAELIRDAGQAISVFLIPDTSMAILEKCGLILDEFDPERRKLSWEAAMLSYMWAFLEVKRGGLERARAYALESIRLYNESGDRWRAFMPLCTIGQISITQGEYDQARQYYGRALNLCQESEDPSVWQAYSGMAEVEFYQGNIDQALDFCRKSIKITIQLCNSGLVTDCTKIWARIYAQNDVSRAVKLLGVMPKALRIWEGSINYDLEQYRMEVNEILPGWQSRADQDLIQQVWEESEIMSIDESWNYIHSLLSA